MHTSIIRASVFLLCLALVALVLQLILLLLALALLHFEFGALFAVACALVVKLVVFGYDTGFAVFAVSTAAGTTIYY